MGSSHQVPQICLSSLFKRSITQSFSTGGRFLLLQVFLLVLGAGWGFLKEGHTNNHWGKGGTKHLSLFHVFWHQVSHPIQQWASVAFLCCWYTCGSFLLHFKVLKVNARWTLVSLTLSSHAWRVSILLPDHLVLLSLASLYLNVGKSCLFINADFLPLLLVFLLTGMDHSWTLRR